METATVNTRSAKNVAAAHRPAALAPGVGAPWSAVFEVATAGSDRNLGGLSLCWIYTGDARLHRRIMALPLSRDEGQWARLQESLALYRLAFGQPRQEDMLATLQRRGVARNPERIAEMRIDLRPSAPHATSWTLLSTQSSWSSMELPGDSMPGSGRLLHWWKLWEVPSVSREK